MRRLLTTLFKYLNTKWNNLTHQERKKYKWLIIAVILLIFDGVLFLMQKINQNDQPDEIIEDLPAYEFNFNRDYEYYLTDLNDVHLTAAQIGGIEPLETREDTIHVIGKILKINSCDSYKVSRLHHSTPYLIPSAKDLLNKIGLEFRDSLLAGGYQMHRIIVTSVLRTNEDVKRLMRVNYNASSNSAHRYATTFDISYNRFDMTDSFGKFIHDWQMENILGKILARLRFEGFCYVKLEKKQRCFHVTCRHYDSLQQFIPQSTYFNDIINDYGTILDEETR